jgi:hypothetical protein
MTTTQTTVRLTAAQARDLSRDRFLAPEAGTVQGLTFTAGPNAVALLRERAAQLNPGYAQPFLLVAAKVEAA